MNYSYDKKFEWNILIVVEQDVGKLPLIRTSKKNEMFGSILEVIKEVICVLKIPLSKDRENNIGECFVDEEIDFKYPNNR